MHENSIIKRSISLRKADEIFVVHYKLGCVGRGPDGDISDGDNQMVI